MPRAKTICPETGCLGIAVREGKCERHARPSWGRMSARNRTRPANLNTLKNRVRARDQWTCQMCGESGREVDHRVPVSRGGEHTEENMWVLCTPCHSEKTRYERFL